MSRKARKPVYGVSNQATQPHIPTCTFLEKGQKFEISDLGIRGIV